MRRSTFAMVFLTMAGGISLPAQRGRGTRAAGDVPQTNPFLPKRGVSGRPTLTRTDARHCHGQTNGERRPRRCSEQAAHLHHGARTETPIIVVRNGIRIPSMPGTVQPSEADWWRMVAYVKSSAVREPRIRQRATARPVLSGVSEKGKRASPMP